GRRIPRRPLSFCSGARLGRCGLGVHVARLTHAAEEERLVDLSLEDGNAQLHALGDDLATVESGLTCELGGRQMNRHTVRSSPRVADGYAPVYIACRGWAQGRW